MPRYPTVIFLIFVLLCLGCRLSPAPDRRIQWRWIEEDPTELLAKSALLHERIVFRLGFSPAELAEYWPDLKPRTVTGDGVRLSGSHPTIVAHTNINAADVHEIVVDLRMPGQNFLNLSLEWAPPGEGFVPQRRVLLKAESSGPSGSKHRFVVAYHPQWRGAIARLRWTVNSPAKVLLREVVGSSSAVVAEKLAPMLARPWKIEVANDVRSAYLTVPGLAISRRVLVPEGAKLRLSYAHLKHSLVPVHYQVILTDGEQRSVLFHRTLAAEELAAPAWRPVLVDLAPWAGKEVELALKSFTDGELSELHGLPVWANPELVVPAFSPPMNVLLISIDTLRADRMSLYGHHRPTTPNITAPFATVSTTPTRCPLR